MVTRDAGHRDNRPMGLEDRDWYWKERQRKERLHYDPKAFRRWRGDASTTAPRSGRPGVGTVIAIVFVVALVLAPTAGRWLRERLAGSDVGAATASQPPPQLARPTKPAARP